jgi:hypothetical protein
MLAGTKGLKVDSGMDSTIWSIFPEATALGAFEPVGVCPFQWRNCNRPENQLWSKSASA